MKIKILMAVVVPGWLLFTLAPLAAEDWTVKGKVYHNVVVGQVDPDKVHITYDGGLGAVDMADLPPELQKRLGYNPSAAKAAAQSEEAAREAALAEVLAEQKAAAPPPAAAAQATTFAPVSPSSSPAPPATAADKQAQIAQLQKQIAALSVDARQQDAADQAAYDNDVYYNNGHLEHRHGLGHSQQAVDDRAQIDQLQEQIATLQRS